MPLNTMKELLIGQLKELHAAERHSREVLPKLAASASDPDLAASLRLQAEETKEQSARLERVFEELGISSRQTGRAETKGMKGLAEDAMKLARMTKADSHVRDAALIAVAQHVEHDQIAGYGCARTWARLLGYQSAADQLQKTLQEKRAADANLSTLAESLNKTALATAAA